ncbi:MAG: hypothetical protein AAGH19_02540 [Pseudomonadota bacterium]
MARLSDEHPSFYYLPTVEMAVAIENHIRDRANLTTTERELLAGLDRRDIQLLLSFHNKPGAS